jgi:hypothetical protein
MALSLLFFLLASPVRRRRSLPLVVFAIAFLWGEQGFHRRQESILQTTRVAFVRAFHFLFFGIVYLCFHWVAKSGQVYAPGIDHPHHAEFSFHALQLKYKYLKWAFNLPDSLVFNSKGCRYLIAVAVLILPFLRALTLRRLWKLDPIAWCGCLWFMVALSPVLFCPTP